jgi:single-strand DNA-binding protein
VAIPEIRYTPDGVGVANFKIAVNRPYKNKQGEREADFIPVVCFDRGNFKLAEYTANQLQKGQLCTVKGSIRVRNYEANDGQKRWVTEIVADEIEYAKQSQGQPEPGYNDGMEDIQF